MSALHLGMSVVWAAWGFSFGALLGWKIREMTWRD